MASNFLQEEEDSEAMLQELKEAFRLYDKEGEAGVEEGDDASLLLAAESGSGR